jgi:hypothetical protein
MGPSLGKERPSQDDSALCSCLTCTKIANVGSGDSHPSAPLRAGFFAKNAKNGAREKWNPFLWWRKRPTPHPTRSQRTPCWVVVVFGDAGSFDCAEGIRKRIPSLRSR